MRIKVIYSFKTEIHLTGNLNSGKTRMIMSNITPHIDTRTKVIYPFKTETHKGTGKIMDYSKTLILPPGMFTSFEEIQAYINECE